MQGIFIIVIALIVGLIIIQFIRLIYYLTLPNLKIYDNETPVSKIEFKVRNLLREENDIKTNR